MDENIREIYRALRTSQDKYTYFLLAVAGAGIGFAVNQTQGLPINWSQVPLGLSVLCWAVSFFYGCKHIKYINSTLYSNFTLLFVEKGRDPVLGDNPNRIAIASNAIREGMASNSDKIGKFSIRQFQYLVLGAVLFIIWHIFEMVLRSNFGN